MPADGFSLSWGSDVPDDVINTGAEEGAGTGLIITFDVYDNVILHTTQYVGPVTLTQQPASIGVLQGTTATFTAAWPENLSAVPGQSFQIRVVSHNNEKAITVPTKALAYGPKGWTVEVKLADGKTEKRPVTRGRSDAENTEIIAGLEAGQVIIVP